MPDPIARNWRKFVEERLPTAAADVQVRADAASRAGVCRSAGRRQERGEAALWAETRFADWRGLSREIAESKRRSGALTGGMQDLRQALRFFRVNPGFAAIAIATLAFGIGGNTAIFTMADALALRGLPYPEPDRLMAIETSWPQPAVKSSRGPPRSISSTCAPAPIRSPLSRRSAPFGATFSPAPDPQSDWKRYMFRQASFRCSARARSWAERLLRRKIPACVENPSRFSRTHYGSAASARGATLSAAPSLSMALRSR